MIILAICDPFEVLLARLAELELKNNELLLAEEVPECFLVIRPHLHEPRAFNVAKNVRHLQSRYFSF